MKMTEIYEAKLVRRVSHRLKQEFACEMYRCKEKTKGRKPEMLKAMLHRENANRTVGHTGKCPGRPAQASPYILNPRLFPFNPLEAVVEPKYLKP